LSPSKIAALALGLIAVPAAAQSIDFSTIVEGGAGYAINPQLRPGASDGAGFGRITISPVLARTTPISQTTLGASYRREEYFNAFGHTQTVTGSLAHSQSFTEHFRVNIGASYVQSDNLLLNPDVDVSQVTNSSDGRKTENLSANAGLSWAMGANDNLSLSAQYGHGRSGEGLLARSYDQYSGDVSYLHSISAWTQVGVRSSVSYYDNSGLSSTSVGPGIVVQHSFNQIWKLNADVGVVVQRSGSPINSTSTSLGFHFGLCGTYPRSSICLSASRQSSASAYGGQNIQTSAGATYSYRLTELSNVSGSVSYGRSSGGTIGSFRSEIFRANANYNRTLTERLSVGAEASGGYYNNGVSGNARSLQGSVYVRVKIG
jgi:hypothetical protein